MISIPTVASKPLLEFSDAEYTSFEKIETVKTKACVNFLEANTDTISMTDLTPGCVIPTWGNQELTVLHQKFIEAVHDAAKTLYHGEIINGPDIRVSRIAHDRVPSALGKEASEPLESGKTQSYQRLVFAFTIPTIYETVKSEKPELCIGGVRNYSDLNLYRVSRGIEKFSIFVGWRILICSDQILTGDGTLLQVEVSSAQDLYQRVMRLFYSFNPAKDVHLIQALSQTTLTETQFAQIIERYRLYQAIPDNRDISRLLITDSQVNNVCRGYYSDKHSGVRNNEISMFDFHNLLTENNKSSYIDSYLARVVSAIEVAVGINNAFRGDSTYQWFLG